MRLFIAIEIPDDIKKGLAEAQSRLKGAGVDASWTRPEGIHLTLKFLGEVPEARVTEIMTALTEAIKSTGGFRIEVAGAGAFPHTRNPRVVWAGISGDTDRLVVLQASVEKAMVKTGFEREDRRFSPHLTLARVKYLRARDNWQKALDGVKDLKLPSFDADHVSLIKSELKPSGAVYTELGKINLK